MRPAKTRISLGTRSVWSVFTVRSIDSLRPKISSCRQWRLWSDFWQMPRLIWVFTDQTGWKPRLIWVFAGHTGHFVGFVMRQLEASSHGVNQNCLLMKKVGLGLKIFMLTLIYSLICYDDNHIPVLETNEPRQANLCLRAFSHDKF